MKNGMYRFIINKKIFIYNLHLLLLFSYIQGVMSAKNYVRRGFCLQGVLSAGGLSSHSSKINITEHFMWWYNNNKHTWKYFIPVMLHLKFLHIYAR